MNPRSGHDEGPDVDDDRRGLGLTPEQIAQLKARDQDAAAPHFEVLPANWLAVQIFLDCNGQWNRDANGTMLAINRTWLQSELQLWPVPAERWADTFARIRVMERHAADIFSKRAQQAAARARNRR